MSKKKLKSKKKALPLGIETTAKEHAAKKAPVEKKMEAAASVSPKALQKKTLTAPPAAQVESQHIPVSLELLEGRWKLLILAQLKGDAPRRFSELERAIPAITQKMLGQQLRQLEADGLVIRTVYPQVPPRVEYRLTPWGQALGPALDALVAWSQQRPKA